MTKAKVPLAIAVAGAGIEGCSAFSSLLSRRENRPGSSALVPRLTLDRYLSSPAHETPVLIRDIVSPEATESLADELMHTLGREAVQMQRKIKDEDDGSRTTEIYDVALQDSVEYMMDSSHGDSYFAFCEGLLRSSVPGSSELRDKLTDIREAPFPNQENWFDYFPSKIKPSDAIILAGTGATSTLHRDPFEWTGTSICLEGTKIWRFILPPPDSQGGIAAVDEALGSYRLDSIAWEEEEHDSSEEPVVLSAGWQSDMTLYDATDGSFPSAIEWVTMEEDDGDKFETEMQNAGMNASCLRPSTNALDALNRIGNVNDSSDGLSTSPLFVTAIQQAGDLLLIPAHCWHQTYAPLPSVAVASQRCGAKVDGKNVVGHILEMLKCTKNNAKLPGMLKHKSYDDGMGKEVVKNLIDHVTRPIPLL